MSVYCVMKSDYNTEHFSPQDYHRPSVEEILENPLIADLVAEEQRRNPERRGRRSEPEKLQDSSPVLGELKLKELQLQERERALRAREERLERKSEWGLRTGALWSDVPAICL